MKKAIVYILALSFLTAALAGCTNAGERPRDDATPAPAGTMVPDVNDGVVSDDDGVIDEDDTGVPATQAPSAGTGAGTTAPGNGTASGGTGTAAPNATGKPGSTAKP